MTKLSWGNSGERFYEAGADRGVLYLKNAPAVPWNGLVSVSENPSGGEPKPYYIDGIKHLNVSSVEEFEATIEAFSSPSEFARCDGTAAIGNGLFITQQPRIPFDFSYRTRIGNDVDGLDHGYKIHLVYNAMAAPVSRDNTTLSDSSELRTLSWDITTTAPVFSGYRPSAHLVIDSRKTTEEQLSIIETMLYGGVDTEPQLISAADITQLFVDYRPFKIVDRGDGSYTAEGTVAVAMATPATFTIDHPQVDNHGDDTFTINY